MRYNAFRRKLFDSPIETCSSRLFFYRLERTVVSQHPYFGHSVPLHVLAYPRFGLIIGYRLVLADVENCEPYAALVDHGLHVRFEGVLGLRGVHGLYLDAARQVGAAYGCFSLRVLALVLAQCQSDW